MDFEIGDRVLVINEYECGGILGMQGTILALPRHADGIYPVQFDDFFDNGHTCGDRGEEGMCWWVDSGCLEHTEKQVTSSGNPILDRSRKLWSRSNYGKKHSLVQTT